MDAKMRNMFTTQRALRDEPMNSQSGYENGTQKNKQRVKEE